MKIVLIQDLGVSIRKKLSKKKNIRSVGSLLEYFEIFIFSVFFFECFEHERGIYCGFVFGFLMRGYYDNKNIIQSLEWAAWPQYHPTAPSQ